MWLYDIKDELGCLLGSEWAPSMKDAETEFMAKGRPGWMSIDRVDMVDERSRLVKWQEACILPPARFEIPGGRCGVVPPSIGWSERSYYVVDVAMASHNPVFRAILYTGILNASGEPSAYASLFWGGHDSTCHFNQVYYLRALAHIGDIDYA